MLALILRIAPEEARDEIARLYEVYGTYMLQIADHILSAKGIVSQDAEDAVQTAFIWICKHTESIPQESEVKKKAYLSVVARNTALKICRQEQKQLSYLARDIDELIGEEQRIPAVEDFSDMLVNKLNPHDALVFLKQLDEKYRDAIFLHYAVKMKIKDIASLQSVSENTVRTRIYRGIQKIREQLKETKGEADYKSSENNSDLSKTFDL